MQSLFTIFFKISFHLQSLWFPIPFLSADSFSSALLVVSSKEGGRGRTFWQVFCSIRFSAQARHLGFESGCMPWSKYLDPELSWGWILGMNFGDEVWGWTFVGRIWYFHPRSGTKVPLALFKIEKIFFRAYSNSRCKSLG